LIVHNFFTLEGRGLEDKILQLALLPGISSYSILIIALQSRKWCLHFLSEENESQQYAERVRGHPNPVKGFGMS
jgi:hypothetical protein